jgi:hypothetical protein
MQRWRDRQKGLGPLRDRPTCQSCGKRHTGAKGPFCRLCWQSQTTEGRAERAARVAKAKAKAKAKADATQNPCIRR